MAIYISHNIYDGSEAQFNWNLTILADSLGFNLLEMEGFGGANQWDILAKNDPLNFLFHNFKSAGQLSASEAGELAERLRELRDIEDKIDLEILGFINQMIRGLDEAYVYDDSVLIYETL